MAAPIIALEGHFHRRVFSTSGPPAGEWSGILPREIVHQTIDVLHPHCDLETLKALTLTCRELKSYCRPLIFQQITIGKGGDAHCRTTDKAPRVILERFAMLLKESPDVADFVRELSIRWLPCKSSLQQSELPQCFRDEAIFSYVLDRQFSALRQISLDTKEILFNDLSHGLQHSLLKVLSSPSLLKFQIAMRSFPNTVLEQCRGAVWLDICGFIYQDLSRPQLPLTIDPSVTKPTVLGMCHVPAECLPILLTTCSPRFDLGRLQLLRFGDSEFFGPGHEDILEKCGSTLISLEVRALNWASSALLQFAKLPALVNITINVTTAAGGGQELVNAMEWLSLSLGTRSLQHAGIALWMDGRQNYEPKSVLKYHQEIWYAVSNVQSRWPNLSSVDISGASVAPNSNIGHCLGPFKDGGHREGSHHHHHDHQGHSSGQQADEEVKTDSKEK